MEAAWFILQLQTCAIAALTLTLLLLFHVALNIEAGHLHLAVGAHGDRLLEGAGKLASAIVCDLQLTLLARHDGRLGVGWHGAAAAGHSLVDDERGIAHVGVSEHARHLGRGFGELAEVVGGLIKLDFGLFLVGGVLRQGSRKPANEQADG